jgi:Tol biopolymer transport system component
MPVVAPHARRLAYVRSTVDTNIWQLTSPEAGQPATSRRQLVASAATDNMPQISLDGQKVAFSSSRSGAPEIWVAGIDGSRPVQMTMLGRSSGTPRWSPDGKQIVFDSNVSGAFEIYIVSAEGGTPRMLTPGPSENYIPSWSHDGRWIYFCSLRTGRQEIWKIPADDGNPVQVTRDGGRTGFESLDGQWLYFKKAEPVGPIWRMPVAGGAENVVVAAEAVGRNFAITRSGIYYMRRMRAGETGPVVDVYRFDTGKTKTIATFGFNVEMGLAVSPDEKRVLYTQIDHQGSNISVAENYQ